MNTLGQLVSEDPSCEIKELQPVQTSPLDNLLRRKKGLELQLQNINNAIEALKENPQVLKVLELLAKAKY